MKYFQTARQHTNLLPLPARIGANVGLRAVGIKKQSQKERRKQKKKLKNGKKVVDEKKKKVQKKSSSEAKS